MGCRSCDKPKMSYRKGLWSPEEDQRLRDFILKNGLGCWSAVPAKAGKPLSLSFLSQTHTHNTQDINIGFFKLQSEAYISIPFFSIIVYFPFFFSSHFVSIKRELHEAKTVLLLIFLPWQENLKLHCKALEETTFVYIYMTNLLSN